MGKLSIPVICKDTSEDIIVNLSTFGWIVSPLIRGVDYLANAWNKLLLCYDLYSRVCLCYLLIFVFILIIIYTVHIITGSAVQGMTVS